MNHQEVMRLALEALENPNSGLVPHDGEWCSRQSIAIAALRAALAEPDSDYERGFVDGMNMQTKRSVDKAVNRMAEQEPVAWMYDFLNPNDREEVIRNWVTQNPDDIEREKGFNVRPLYTAPTPNTLEESNGDD